MDIHTREFVEVIRLDDFVRIVRVGYWFHELDKETDEGKWEWHGPPKKTQTTRAFSYKEWLPEFPQI